LILEKSKININCKEFVRVDIIIFTNYQRIVKYELEVYRLE
jgi:hypothetical protein